ncbi:MAG: zinc ribbon domain-containing protein [Chloroflexi bacterium]|nr:zinc ribbon domain-containing protein [Chloroflexota bacterium]
MLRKFSRPTSRAAQRVLALAVGKRSGPLLAAALTAALVGAAPLNASAEPQSLSIKNMKVSVQPEYDDPRVLVTYEGEFVGESSFGRKVQFFIPKGAEINQVCALRKPADEHLCQLYDTDAASQSLTFTLPIPTFYLEFYYQPLEGSPDKKMDFGFQSFYPVGKLQLDLQQPLRVSNFVATPKAEKIGTDGRGFSYHQYQFDNVTANQPVKVSASYTKTDPKPSVEKAKPGAAGTGDVNVILLGAIGIGILGLVAFYAMGKRRPQPVRVYNRRPGPPAYSRGPDPAVNIPQRAPAQASRQARATARGRTAVAPPIAREARASFCTSCGTEILADENFCPNCGQKARKLG